MLLGTGLPILLFLILAVWGLKDDELYCGEVAVCAAIIVVSRLVCFYAGWSAYYSVVPTVIIDVWLLHKMDMLGVTIPR